jgi:hypothetical protein
MSVEELRPRRAATLIAALAGGLGSAGLMLYAGQRVHSPRLLLFLFTLWVLAPFLALLLAVVVAQRWSAPARTALHYLTLAIAPASLAIYAVTALGPARPKTAVFVLVAPLSWLLIATVLAIVALRSARSAHRRNAG